MTSTPPSAFHRLRRTAAVTLAAAAVGAALAGCGTSSSGASGDDTTPRIAYFMGDQENRFMAASLQGVKDIVEKEGGTVTAFDGNFDPATQQSQIQDALTSGRFNAFIVGPVNNVALVPSLEEAIAQGIPVASNGFPLGPDMSTNEAQLAGQVMSAVEPSSRVGELIGTATVQACADFDPCKVVYMSGDPTIANEKIKYDEFAAAIDGHDNVDVVTRATSDYLADPARQTMQDVLQSNPDVNVVATVGDQMANGAAQAGIAAGADFKVIGQGASEIAFEGVKAGTWYASIIGLPYDEGTITANAVIAALKGEKVAPNYSDPAVDAGYTDGLLTAEFIQQHPDFKPQWSG